MATYHILHSKAIKATSFSLSRYITRKKYPVHFGRKMYDFIIMHIIVKKLSSHSMFYAFEGKDILAIPYMDLERFTYNGCHNPPFF